MLGRIARLGTCLGLGFLLLPVMIVNAAGSPISRSLGVTAALPGRDLVALSKMLADQSSTKGQVRRQLARGEGTGADFCAEAGGSAIGANFDDVYACGPALGVADDFDSVGFQCVELSERFLWVTQGEFVPDVADGRDMVQDVSNQYGTSIGTPGPGSVPAPGDIVSLWGGPDAQPYGHTAVVTSVNVDSSGNGTITVMEENGLADGWDSITVSNWSESFGDPNWDGGYYYYNNIEWLELNPSSVAPPPPTTTAYRATSLGVGSRADVINDTGTVAGVVVESTGNDETTKPFLYGDGGMQYPGSPAASTAVSGLNNHGTVAGWSSPTGSARGYALKTQTPTQWQALPHVGASGVPNHTTSIDPTGDITGWERNRDNSTSAMGIVWMHARHGYRVLKLAADLHFSNPIVTAADHWGDAVGTEMYGTAKTFATIWAPWGKAYRLPSLSKVSTYSNAAAMSVQKTGTGSRTLTIVGGSENAQGVRQACEWIVEVTPGYVSWAKPKSLASSALSNPSTAVAVNASGWVVGRLWPNGTSGGAFLYRPVLGMVDLQSLLPSSTFWKIQSAVSVNAGGEIVGQAQGDNGHGQARGVLLTPQTSAD